MHELDVEMIRKLYAFGGLIVYRVSYFDAVLFSVETRRVTFSQEAAKAELERLKLAGFTAEIESFLVGFDGAFSIAPIDSN